MAGYIPKYSAAAGSRTRTRSPIPVLTGLVRAREFKPPRRRHLVNVSRRRCASGRVWLILNKDRRTHADYYTTALLCFTEATTLKHTAENEEVKHLADSIRRTAAIVHCTQIYNTAATVQNPVVIWHLVNGAKQLNTATANQQSYLRCQLAPLLEWSMTVILATAYFSSLSFKNCNIQRLVRSGIGILCKLICLLNCKVHSRMQMVQASDMLPRDIPALATSHWLAMF